MHANVTDIVFLYLSLFYSLKSKLLFFLKEGCYKRMEFSGHNSFKRLHVCKRQMKQPPLIWRQHLLHKVTINDNTRISFVADFYPAASTHMRCQQRGPHVYPSVPNDCGKMALNLQQILVNVWNQSLHKSLLRTSYSLFTANSPSLFGIL